MLHYCMIFISDSESSFQTWKCSVGYSLDGPQEDFGTSFLEKDPDMSFHLNLLSLCIEVTQMNILSIIMHCLYAQLVDQMINQVVSSFSILISSWLSYKIQNTISYFFILYRTNHGLIFTSSFVILLLTLFATRI